MRTQTRTIARTAAGSALAAAVEDPPQALCLSLLYKHGVMGDVSGGFRRGARVSDDLMWASTLTWTRLVGAGPLRT
jgi:hypothetical protein